MTRHPLAWCAWAIAALAAAFMDRNPFLQALLLLVLINVWLPYRRGRPLYLRIGLALAVLPILFSAALSRYGHHVIVTVPPVPIVGGAWTWEAIVFGASSGAALLLTVVVFATVQSVMRSSDLVGLLPSPLARAGTAFALSIAFAPRTIRSFQLIQEARRLRGQRNGWRSAPSVLVPLLLTTLEQALQYGESLDSRGYGNRRRSSYRPLTWSAVDVVTALTSAAAFALIIGAPAPAYAPYTSLVPAAPPIGSVVALLLLTFPALLAAFSRRDHDADHA